jgi:hypothetical protein
MLQSMVIGIGAIVTMMVMWMVVQRLWGQTFSEHMTDEDAMSGRTKCSNCGCTTACENKAPIVETKTLNYSEIK